MAQVVDETTAKTMFCPWSSAALNPTGTTYVTGSRKDDGTLAAGCTCIASGCMAWTWVTTTTGMCGALAQGYYSPIATPGRK